MVAEIVTSSASVVLIGSFNPKIFHPIWMAKHNLIGEAEAGSALDAQAAPGEGLEVIHRDVTLLKLNWLDLSITPERFAVKVTEEPAIRARDFAVRCFQVLEHTPIRAMGINRTAVLLAPSKDSWQAFGDKLAPKDVWSSLASDDDPGRRVLGLRELVIERMVRPDEFSGSIRVILKGEHRFRTSVEVNDHYAFVPHGENSPDLISGREVVEILDQQWESSIARADRVIAELARGHDENE